MSSLNPCPFCGCNYHKILGNYCNSIAAVACPNCGAQGPKMETNYSYKAKENLEEKAMRAWNKAMQPSKKPEQ